MHSLGHTVIPLYSQCFEVPLYRQAIIGRAIAKELAYTQPVQGDEVENLYELLTQVLRAHPDVEGVAVGAIISTYQRLRVEHVCLRLGLIPLAYLWLRNRDTLLHNILDSGVNAVAVKVAGAGNVYIHIYIYIYIYIWICIWIYGHMYEWECFIFVIIIIIIMIVIITIIITIIIIITINISRFGAL